MIHVIIFGSNGMLGNYCKKYFSSETCNTNFKVTSLSREDIDCQNITYNELLLFLKKNIKYDDTWVINCTGIIKQRQCSNQEMINVNSIFPHILHSICQSLNIKMIHITTDCVYNGEKGNYKETDTHDCDDIYGISKSSGEGKFMSIRTSIIGEELYNKKSLIEWVKSQNNKPINGYTNHLWNGVTCLQLSKILHNIITTNKIWEGTRHLFSDEILSKYELVNMVVKIYNLNITISPVKTEKKCDRSLCTIFDDKFIVPSLYTQIEEQYKFFNTECSKVTSDYNIFLITSAINPISSTIDKGHTRSVFTSEERLNQTINTVNTIRNKVHNSYCVIIESTILSNTYKNKLAEICDLFIDCSKNNICSHFVNGDNKSMGETTTLYYAMKLILEKEIKFNTISKISGRYYLDDNYKCNFSNDLFTFKEFQNDHSKWYSTVLYTVGWNVRWLYLDILFSSLILMSNSNINDIERTLYNNVPIDKVQLRNFIGASGLTSASGELIHH